MSKSFNSDQTAKLERPYLEPIYFVHIYLSGETLYFSDRNFKFNGHDYEAYLLDVPLVIQSIERFGGYLNLDARLRFRNNRFRSYTRLIDFFIANPPTKREMDVFALYIENSLIPGSDLSTLLHRVSLGEYENLGFEEFDIQLHSLIHKDDNKKFFTEINRNNWPNAIPSAIGKYENMIVGQVRDMPIHPADVGPFSTLYSEIDNDDTELTLTDTDYPIFFPDSGTVQIGNEKITYTGINSTTRQLTGLTRAASGTKAAYHSAGDVVWLVKASYKYLCDTGVMKAVSNVYVGANRTKIDPADYTITLNDSGKTTVAFTERPMEIHAHAKNEIEIHRPNAGSYANIVGTLTWEQVPGNMIDNDLNTWFNHVQYTGTFGSPRTGAFYIDFPTYNGPTPKKVYAVFVMDTNVGTACGEYVRLQEPEQINIGELAGKTTVRKLLTGTSIPTRLTVYSHHDAGSSVNLMCQIFEAWLELEGTLVDPSSTDMDPIVTIDGEGYPDDGSGTYTGTPSKLIDNPSDVLRWLLMAKLGRSAGEIGTSFGTMRTLFDAQIPGGYKFGGNLITLGKDISDIFRALQEQCCSAMREDSGKFHLEFLYHSYTWAYSVDRLIGGSATASSNYFGYSPINAFDYDLGSMWRPDTTGDGPHWIKHDQSAGVSNILTKFRFKCNKSAFNSAGKDFVFAGSNNDSDWITLYSGQLADNENWQEFTFANSTAYRYHRLTINTIWEPSKRLAIEEIDLGGQGSASTGSSSVYKTWNNSESDGWDGDEGHWIKYDFGLGITKIINRLRMKCSTTVKTPIKDFRFQGSNDNTSWTVLLIGQHQNNSNWQTFDFSNLIGFRYYRLMINTVWNTDYTVTLQEMEFCEKISTPGSGPSSVMTIDKYIYIGEPKFSFTRAGDIRNLIRVCYNRDWSGTYKEGKKFGDYRNQLERSTSPADLSEDVNLPMVYIPEMAEDIANWRLLQKKGIVPAVELICNAKIKKLERNDYFALNDVPVADWEGDLWRILSIHETPENETFLISAIKYIAP